VALVQAIRGVGLGDDLQHFLGRIGDSAPRMKTLHANLGGHASVPWFEVDDTARIFTQHLK
jgi:hypothetical protein